MMTTKFGSWWIVDGLHPRIRIGPHRDLRKEVKNSDKFEQQKTKRFQEGLW